MIFGLLSGYKFVSFRILFFVIYKENDKIKFSYSLSSIAGQCLMAPQEYNDDFKYTLYNLGGGIMNFIIALIAGGISVLSIFYLRHEIIFFIFFSTFLLNIFSGLLNLIPLIISGVPNDGMNQKTARKSKQAQYGFYLMLYTNYQLTKGKRFKDFDEKMFKIEDSLDLNNYLECYILMCEADRLSELGKKSESIEVLNIIDVEKLPKAYKSMVFHSKILYYFVYNKDFKKAEELYNDKDFQKFLKLNFPINNLVKATYEYFVNEDKKATDKYLAKEKKIALSYPNIGQRNTFLELIDDFEKQM